jgi:hypothetical protein
LYGCNEIVYAGSSENKLETGMKMKDERKMEIKSVKHLQKSENKVKKGAGCLMSVYWGKGTIFQEGGLILCQYVDP